MRIGDAVVLREGAVEQDRLADLAGIEERVGAVWDEGGEELCNIVYERRGCVLAEAPSSRFVTVAEPTTQPF